MDESTAAAGEVLQAALDPARNRRLADLLANEVDAPEPVARLTGRIDSLADGCHRALTAALAPPA